MIGEINLILKDEEKRIILDTLKNSQKSNCFMTYETIEEKCYKNCLEIIFVEGIVLAIEDKHFFNELYFFLDDIEKIDWNDLSKRLNAYDKLVINYVNREGAFDFQLAEKLGFDFYRKYIRKRFINKNPKKYRELMDVIYADVEDCNTIYRLLYDVFDPIGDWLVDENELKELIQNKNVLKISLGQDIAGVFLFEDTGKTTYARTLCVNPKYQNNVFGYSLYSKYINDHIDDYKMFYLWVDAANEGVHKLHDNFGYIEDGLVNYIYVRKEKKDE